MNRALGASLTMVAIVWLWLVRSYIPDVPTEGEPGPRAFPFLLGVLLAILGAALALSPPAGAPAGRDDLSSARPAARTRVALTTFALLIAYAFLLDKAGFIASTIVLIVALLAGILGLRRWVMIGGLAVAFTMACWVVFVSLLGVPLPGGSWMQ